MSAKILQFAPRARRDRRANEVRNVFRSEPHPDDLTMDHADTAPCECIGSREEWQEEDEPA